MKFIKIAVASSALVLSLGAAAIPSEPSSQNGHVDFMETCHLGLVFWTPKPPSNPKCGETLTPQVKVFDGSGKLRFIGSALAAIQWAKANEPNTTIPASVVVRDVGSEARITHVKAPSSGHGMVTYYMSKPCEPCERHLAMFRSEAMPKLGVGTELSVVELTQ